jgi:hypothetical protein
MYSQVREKLKNLHLVYRKTHRIALGIFLRLGQQEHLPEAIENQLKRSLKKY